MKKFKLNDMVKGWFVGDFDCAYNTTSAEVAIKHYKCGDHEISHHHKLATELTVIILGEVKMNGITYIAGDIVLIEPGESCDFKCITDVITCVYKSGSFKNDKYID
jgi:hypothetical protein